MADANPKFNAQQERQAICPHKKEGPHYVRPEVEPNYANAYCAACAFAAAMSASVRNDITVTLRVR